MKNDQIIWIVASESTPEKEAEFNEWYNEQITRLFKFKGMKKASRYRCYEVKEPCNKYLAIYEFNSKEDLGAFYKSPEFAAAGKIYEDTWKGKKGFDVKWSGWYESVRIFERESTTGANTSEKTGNDSEYSIVAVGPDPNLEKEAEFNKWYDEHMSILFEFEGMKKTIRYRCFNQIGDQKCIKYWVSYEFCSKEDLETWHHSPAYANSNEHYMNKASGLFDVVSLGWYERIKLLERD